MHNKRDLSAVATRLSLIEIFRSTIHGLAQAKTVFRKEVAYKWKMVKQLFINSDASRITLLMGIDSFLSPYAEEG